MKNIALLFIIVFFHYSAQALIPIAFFQKHSNVDKTPDAIDWADFVENSSTQTLTGFNGPITLRLATTTLTGSPQVQYSINGGGWVTVTDLLPADVVFSAGDTLAFAVGGISGDLAQLSVTNLSDGGASIDTVEGRGGAPFISTWQTTTPSESITLPLLAGFSYNFTVDWGDGSPVDTVTSDTDPDRVHTYATAGTYTVTMTGLMETFSFQGAGDKDKILSIPELGDMGWISFVDSFWACTNLGVVNGGDTSNVLSMAAMFAQTPNAEPDGSTWDTSQVTDMYAMFYQAAKANPDTSGWNTSEVTDMGGMFYQVTVAQPDTSGWNTAKVTNLLAMFRESPSINPNTSGWNTSAVTNMDHVFNQAPSANPDVSGWDTSNVTTMLQMFYQADSAVIDVSGWNTGNVTNMYAMFFRANLMNPDVSSWDVSKVTNMQYMFDGVPNATPDITSWVVAPGLTSMRATWRNTTQANLDFSNIDLTNITDFGVTFIGGTSTTPLNYANFLIRLESMNSSATGNISAGSIQYDSSAATARAALVTRGWTISDGGQL